MTGSANRLCRAPLALIIGILNLNISHDAMARAPLIDGFSASKSIVHIVMGDIEFDLPRRDIRFTVLDRDHSIESIDLVGTAPDLWGVIPAGVFDPGSKANSDSMQSVITFIPGISRANVSLLPAGVSGEESEFGLSAYKEPKVQDTIYIPSKPFPRRLQIMCVLPTENLDYCRIYTTYGNNISISITFDQKNLSKWREIDRSVQKILSNGSDGVR